MVIVRYDKRFPVRRLSDRLLLLTLSLLFIGYVVFNKRLRHVERTRIADYPTFVKRIVGKRLFLIEPTYYPEIQLFCRFGHEMDNLLVRDYEEKVRSSFTPNSRDIVVDVGAHLGEYTVIAARNALKVIAIEPNPDVFQLLQKNLRINRISNVIMVNKAVYDSPGHHSLLVFGDRTGMGSMILRYQDKAKEIKVATDTLDNILSDLQTSKIDWIKVDVEGAEVHVLNSAKTTLLANREHVKLIIESHTDETTVMLKEMLEKQFDFDCKMLDKNHIFVKSK